MGSNFIKKKIQNKMILLSKSNLIMKLILFGILSFMIKKMIGIFLNNFSDISEINVIYNTIILHANFA